MYIDYAPSDRSLKKMNTNINNGNFSYKNNFDSDLSAFIDSPYKTTQKELLTLSNIPVQFGGKNLKFI